MTTTLFSSQNPAPLAHCARPTRFEEFQGQAHLFERHPSLLTRPVEKIGSIILWGPPGSGKTTLAHLLAKQSKVEIFSFNPLFDSRTQLKKFTESAIDVRDTLGKKSVIFIDEIHRFNRPGQDALLPHLERGDFILIGATTENPKSCLNRAFLSRVQIVELKKHSPEDIFTILSQAAKTFELPADSDVLEYISGHTNGDARLALNVLEKINQQEGEVDLQSLHNHIFENNRDYDKDKHRHYDVISAFIKSLRGSDPDAALLWLAVMLDGGEDPAFIARRLLIFASEDVGNADPGALTLAVSGLHAVEHTGMPEARIILAQVATYLASTHKSASAYKGITAALEHVSANPTLEVPSHLKNYGADATDYKYPHDHPGNFVRQTYAPAGTPRFYNPGENGTEKKIKERLQNLWQN